jgi:hypothetical protein
VIAAFQAGEWASLLTALVVVFASVSRIVRAANRNLAAIKANSAQNEALAKQAEELAAQVEAIGAEQVRMNRDGSQPVRRVLRKLEGEVLPKLDDVKRTVENGE